MVIPITTTNVEPDISINEVSDMSLKEELHSCQHLLVDSRFEWAIHKVFDYAKNINATIVDENLDRFFNHLKYAAEMNLAFKCNIRKKKDLGVT